MVSIMTLKQTLATDFPASHSTRVELNPQANALAANEVSLNPAKF